MTKLDNNQYWPNTEPWGCLASDSLRNLAADWRDTDPKDPEDKIKVRQTTEQSLTLLAESRCLLGSLLKTTDTSLANGENLPMGETES